MKREIESVNQKTDDSFPKPRTILSAELLSGQREVLIAHCQEVYRLRLTRNAKLILTK